ncbi:hypothetical protein WG902_04420 [Ramlibacter sp. PS3R-8]|uniref:hypothetical protein n=1 Tax=Ramlibacter sp. PS3R-8 TaxID=3133437 RepID=UPI0030A93BC9
MSTQTKTTEASPAATTNAAAARPADRKQRAISDPREVASVVMARMNLVNAKKDELAIAIHGLVDIAQQLTRSYGEQLLAMEQLRRRVKELEQAAASTAAVGDRPASIQ